MASLSRRDALPTYPRLTPGDERHYETWLLWRARTEPVADEVANSVEAGMRERITGMTLRELAARK